MNHLFTKRNKEVVLCLVQINMHTYTYINLFLFVNKQLCYSRQNKNFSIELFMFKNFINTKWTLAYRVLKKYSFFSLEFNREKLLKRVLIESSLYL